MAKESVQKPASTFVPVQKKASESVSLGVRGQRVESSVPQVQEQAVSSTPATDASWLMKSALFTGQHLLQKLATPESELVRENEAEKNDVALSSSLPVQAKLTIGKPGDQYEQEADRVAVDVVQRIHASETKTAGEGVVQRQEMAEEEEVRLKSQGGSLQRVEISQLNPKSESGNPGEASADLEASIQGARGSGQPLAESVREPMERELGADFSGVRVHTDAKSDALNQSIQAKAFTTGSDIFFRQGAYEPTSRGGQELLAHELTHVVQQKGGQVEVQRNAAIGSSDAVVQRKVKVHLDSDFHSAALKQTIVNLDVTKMPTVKAAAMKEALKRQGSKRGGGNLLSTTHNSLDTNTGISTRHVIPEQSYRDELTHRLRGNTLGEAREWLNQALGVQQNDPNVRVDIQNKADVWLERRINDPTDIFLGTTQENLSLGENYDDPQTADRGAAFTEEEKYRIAAYYYLRETPKALGDEQTLSLSTRVNQALSSWTNGQYTSHDPSDLIAHYYSQAQKSYYKTPEEKNQRDQQWKNPLPPLLQEENNHILKIMAEKLELAVREVMTQIASLKKINPNNPGLHKVAIFFLTTVRDTVLIPMTRMLESQARRGEDQGTRAQRAQTYFQNVIETAISANQGAVLEHAQRLAQQSMQQPQLMGGNALGIPATTGTLVAFHQPIQDLSPQDRVALNTPVLPGIASLLHGTYQHHQSGFVLPPMNPTMSGQAYQSQSQPLQLTSPFRSTDQQLPALTGGNATIQNLLPYDNGSN